MPIPACLKKMAEELSALTQYASDNPSAAVVPISGAIGAGLGYKKKIR